MGGERGGVRPGAPRREVGGVLVLIAACLRSCLQPRSARGGAGGARGRAASGASLGERGWWCGAPAPCLVLWHAGWAGRVSPARTPALPREAFSCGGCGCEAIRLAPRWRGASPERAERAATRPPGSTLGSCPSPTPQPSALSPAPPPIFCSPSPPPPFFSFSPLSLAPPSPPLHPLCSPSSSLPSSFLARALCWFPAS